jgi:hypothetical protein
LHYSDHQIGLGPAFYKIKRYGERALEESASHAKKLASAGDDNGIAVWRRITASAGSGGQEDEAIRAGDILTIIGAAEEIKAAGYDLELADLERDLIRTRTAETAAGAEARAAHGPPAEIDRGVEGRGSAATDAARDACRTRAATTSAIARFRDSPCGFYPRVA